MARNEAQALLDQFNRSSMAGNPHRKWIGKLLERAARGESLGTMQITMVQAALATGQS